MLESMMLRYFFIMFVLLLPLAGCAQVEGLRSTMLGKEAGYKPLTYDVATIAAPQDPAAAQESTPPVICRIGKGVAHFGKTWKEFSDAEMSIPANNRSNVVLSARKGSDRLSLQGFFDADGQKMIFCPVIDAPPETRIDCTSVYALGDDLDMGIKRTFDVPDAIRGGAITCAFSASKLRNL